MEYGTPERIAHVYRRLGLGGHPRLAAATATVDEAITTALDLSTPPHVMPEMEVPLKQDDAIDPPKIRQAIQWWVESAIQPTRLIEERLTWFWTDHFATSLSKVPIPYVHWDQHLTIRSHATGNFADLLKAVSKSPAMLGYLDGIRNNRETVNENFAREVMELHTIGVGNYTQGDVTEAARAFTGWTVNIPFADRNRRLIPDSVQPWKSFHVELAHDSGSKTLLDTSGNLDMDGALDVLLDHPNTRPRIAAKLFTALVGFEPDQPTTDRLAAAFDDYEVMPVVEAIVADPAFRGDAAIRNRIRNPFERFLTVVQAFGEPRTGVGRYLEWLHGVRFLPFNPPNPAGYQSGAELLGPHAVIHGFDLAQMVDPRLIPDDPFSALGIFEPLAATEKAVTGEPDPRMRLALLMNAPEMYLT